MVNLQVRVQPRSSQNRVEVVGGAVKVWTSAAPADGQANAAVCELLADRLAVPKSSVEVVRGHASRSKTIRVTGLSEKEIEERLAEGQ